MLKIIPLILQYNNKRRDRLPCGKAAVEMDKELLRSIIESDFDDLQDESKDDGKLKALLKSIANNVWRLEGRMTDPATREPKEEFTRHYRHIEAMKDSLEDFGVKIVDFTGVRYDGGMAVNVIANEGRSDATRVEITETLKPTVRLHDQQLQMADVVVVHPVENENA